MCVCKGGTDGDGDGGDGDGDGGDGDGDDGDGDDGGTRQRCTASHAEHPFPTGRSGRSGGI